MKNKKYLAIGLSISILISSFSGVYISYAGNEITIKESMKDSDANTKRAPETEIIQYEPKINSGKIETYISSIEDINSDEVSSKLIKDSSPVSMKSHGGIVAESDIKNEIQEDLNYIDAKEIEKLEQEGLSDQDIIDAVNMANCIGEDPIKILDMKKESKKSVEDIKKDIFEEKKEKAINSLKTKYENEFKKLIKADLSEDEIVAFLGYIDANGLKMTNELIKEYRKLGEELFRKDLGNTLSVEYKNKYKITNKDEKKINDRIIREIEEWSKEQKVSADNIINNYLKNN